MKVKARSAVAAVAAVAMTIAARVASAQESDPEQGPQAQHPYVPSRRARRPDDLAPPTLNLDGTIGVGGPVGWLGLGASVRPVDRFALGAGAGLGTHGVQLASALHAYPIDLWPQTRLGFGAGVSTGTFVATRSKNIDLYWDRYFERAWLLNLQTSILFWERSGFSFEPHAGYGIVLNPRDGACADWRSTCGGFSGVFFLGMTFRYGVWL